MAFWNIDLTTEDGALSAAQIGSYACFVAAVLGLIGTALLLGVTMGVGLSRLALIGAAVALVEVVLFTVAGFRLRTGRGVAWGWAAAIVLAIELVTKALALSITGIMIDVILLICVINGIRGARALGRIGLSAEDAGEIFS